jgi:hypothetical protein
MRFALAICIAASMTLWAQAPAAPPTAPPQLQNNGKPMRVDFQCTDEDIQSAGMSCSEEEPCPVYLELSAFEAVGNRLFAAGNIHSAATTLYSVLLASDDAGKLWHEPYGRIRSSGLEHVQFVDFEAGWISGQVLNPLPRDPFLLITTDGGKSWRQKPIFDEGRAGVVQQIWFDSRKNGTMVIDRTQSGEGTRFELYESPNGGETWMIRESSDRPIRIKRAPAETANEDWRLTPDARSKAYRVEKRQGAQWTVVASFLVPIGTCKPAPPSREPEPPPEVTAPKPETPAPRAPAAPRRPPTLKRPAQ